METRIARIAATVLEPIHITCYFSPETAEHLTAIGLRPGRMVYYAGRAAPMGAVGPGVVTATFYNFSPGPIAKNIPRAWTLASPADVVAARLAAVDAALVRLLGEAGCESPEVVELNELAREATAACTPEGRPLYAAYADLEWPEKPYLAVWHAASLLREYRGGGHIAALVQAGIPGLDALLLHIATGRSFTREFAQPSRGWTDQEWDTAAKGLVERGLIDAENTITEAGLKLRSELEAATDRAAMAPWEALGEAKTNRLIELGGQIRDQLATAGAGPKGVFVR
ncbi:SCO6745 family protein [Fodinicola feengrottensis]|uniref:SalK n=1 Tax=Fodinicola feengrottensis TaxID=435914 RepID=A0ABN2HSP1_9ACTN|nr:hypothetical protein [Fodinicola feengrottensis]